MDTIADVVIVDARKGGGRTLLLIGGLSQCRGIFAIHTGSGPDHRTRQEIAVNSRVKKTLTSLTVSALLVTAGMAVGEGSRSSSVTNIAYDFKTRSWKDNHNDAAQTKWSMWSCTKPAASGNSWELYREISLYPDDSYGTRSLGCGSATTSATWGTPTAVGNFHLSFRGGNVLTSQVKASY